VFDSFFWIWKNYPLWSRSYNPLQVFSSYIICLVFVFFRILSYFHAFVLPSESPLRPARPIHLLLSLVTFVQPRVTVGSFYLWPDFSVLWFLVYPDSSPTISFSNLILVFGSSTQNDFFKRSFSSFSLLSPPNNHLPHPLTFSWNFPLQRVSFLLAYFFEFTFPSIKPPGNIRTL